MDPCENVLEYVSLWTADDPVAVEKRYLVLFLGTDTTWYGPLSKDGCEWILAELEFEEEFASLEMRVFDHTLKACLAAFMIRSSMSDSKRISSCSILWRNIFWYISKKWEHSSEGDRGGNSLIYWSYP